MLILSDTTSNEALNAAKNQGRNRVLPAEDKYLSGGQGELAVTHHGRTRGNGESD